MNLLSDTGRPCLWETVTCELVSTVWWGCNSVLRVRRSSTSTSKDQTDWFDARHAGIPPYGGCAGYPGYPFSVRLGLLQTNVAWTTKSALLVPPDIIQGFWSGFLDQ
eukprot:4015564-Amphidinium_carterae.1